MDLALGFTSPMRRNSKMDLPLSVYKSKTYDNSGHIHIPMENYSTNICENSSSYRITRFVLPQLGSSCTYLPKSSPFNKSGPALHKLMVPKEHTLAFSISQQTIVGGFVGSKTHAGRSMFGDSSQIWDAVVCKFVELLSLDKEKHTSMASKDKMSNYSSSVSGSDHFKDSHPQGSKEGMCNSESVPCSSSRTCFPRNHKVTSLPEPTNTFPYKRRIRSPTECKSVLSKPQEPTPDLNKDILPPHRGTYSSVVDGTFKSESRADTESCPTKNFSNKDESPKVTQPNQREQLQTYAEVAKIIPKKLIARPKNSGCEVARTLRNMWNSKIKRNQSNLERKVNCQESKRKTITVDDIMSNRDTRWKGDWKSKRAKFQRSPPTVMPSDIKTTSNSEPLDENATNESITKETIVEDGSEPKLAMEEREPLRSDAFKEGLRRRYPSECSLDSEDSFVIFEECPDTSLATSTRIPIDHNSSLEESDSEEDDSSASDNSDYEEYDADGGVHSLSFTPSIAKEDCKWVMIKCSTIAVPEKSQGRKKKMVHFAEGSHLAEVRPMIAWGYAYRESRRGPWEEHARDRARFHCRIASLAPMLNAILDPIHRRNVMTSRLHNL